MSDKSNRLFTWINRYISVTFLTVVILLCYILFFTDNSVTRSWELSREINDLKAEIKLNNDSLLLYEQLYHDLQTDPATMERIVRENYHMQRPNEDVYMVE